MHEADSTHHSILKRLRGKPLPRRFATIDIETTDWVNPYAVGFYDGSRYKDFLGSDCIEQSIRHVLTPGFAGMWIYAHNGGNFDFLFFLRTLLTSPEFKRHYIIDITPVGSSIISISVSKRDLGDHKPDCIRRSCKGCLVARNKDGNLKWTFVDSVRLLPIKLNEVGEAFGIGKKVELAMSYNDLAKQENRPLMRNYLEQDCKLLYAAVGKMQGIVNGIGGQLCVTLPSTSLDVFRRKFQKHDIYTNRHFVSCSQHNKKEDKDICKSCMHDFIRKAYHGGRSEIYTMRFQPYRTKDQELIKTAKLYDFKAHYPSCMLENMPTGSAIEVENLSEESVFKNNRTMVGMVDCDVEIPRECYLPPLPVPHQGKLIFPAGKLSGVWDSAELALLPRVGGRIVRTRRSLWFETEPVFHRFVRELFKYRDKSRPGWNKAMDWIAKIMLNASYGKFAMREDRNRILVGPKNLDGLTCIDLDSDVWSEDVFVSPNYIVPQLSVHVTALARVRLWETLWTVVQGGGRIYYTDTDSVVCSGFDLPTGTDLGMMELEATINRAEFILPKLYLIETDEITAAKQKKKKLEKELKVKAKGMGPGIRLNEDGDDPYDGQLSQAEFDDLVQRGVPLQRHRLTKLRESLNGYAKSALSFPRVVASPKEIRTKYDKRVVHMDYNTSAVGLEMW